jgi:hypothetical protein
MKTKKYGNTLATMEFLATGGRLTRLEAIILFGISDLPKLVSQLRKQGWIIKSQRIPYARALLRLNQNTKVEVPKNLPTTEIQLTEYWLSK